MRDLTADLSGAEKIPHWSMPARIVRYLAGGLEQPPMVIEIGTGYGDQLQYFAPLCQRVFSIDVMYDWVPDIKPSESFDPTRVDAVKMSTWHSASAAFSSKVVLITGSSYEVCSDPAQIGQFSGSNIIIVDGCHHPSEAVQLDYWNFFDYLAVEHYAVFDDMQENDCSSACNAVVEKLKLDGHSVVEAQLEGSDNISARLLFIKKKCLFSVSGSISVS